MNFLRDNKVIWIEFELNTGPANLISDCRWAWIWSTVAADFHVRALWSLPSWLSQRRHFSRSSFDSEGSVCFRMFTAIGQHVWNFSLYACFLFRTVSLTVVLIVLDEDVRLLLPRREAGGFLMYPPCLESQGYQFDPTFMYLLLFFCLVLLLFLSDRFLLLTHSPDFFFRKPPFSER